MNAKLNRLIPLLPLLAFTPFKTAFAGEEGHIGKLIKALKSSDNNSELQSQTDRIEIIEGLSNQEKDEIILRLLNLENGLELDFNGRVLDQDYLNDVAARSFLDN